MAPQHLRDGREVTDLWNRRPINVLIRSRVHFWSSQPCATGPLASSSSSAVNSFSLSLGRAAEPLEFRVTSPPSCQARYQRCTERTLTPSCFATTALLRPAANNGKQPGRLQTETLAKRPSFAGQTAALRIPHGPGIPRRPPPASPLRHHAHKLSNVSPSTCMGRTQRLEIPLAASAGTYKFRRGDEIQLQAILRARLDEEVEFSEIAKLPNGSFQSSPRYFWTVGIS